MGGLPVDAEQCQGLQAEGPCGADGSLRQGGDGDGDGDRGGTVITRTAWGKGHGVGGRNSKRG